MYNILIVGVIMSSLLEEYYECTKKSERLLFNLNEELGIYWDSLISIYNEYFHFNVCEENLVIKIFIIDNVLNNEFLTVYYEDFINEFDLKLIKVTYTHNRSKGNNQEHYEYVFAHNGNEFYDSIDVDELIL